MEPKVLNLGCGLAPISDAVNHDIRAHSPHVDFTWDLNVLPWPWKDDEFDSIVAKSVFEHLDIDLLHSMDETWRILKSGGELYLKLPYWNSSGAYSDPTHRYYYDPEVLDNFDPRTERGQKYVFYSDRKWRVKRWDFVNEQKWSFSARMVKIG